MWVRTASKRDVEAISQLLGRVWHDTYDEIYGVEKVAEITGQWHSISALEQNLKTPVSEFLVADDGNKIAGTAFASRINDTTVKLHRLYILPEIQGRGVGRMLLEEIEGCFFEFQNLTLEVEEQNKSAIGFYQKHGFNQTGITANCGEGESGIEALIFNKSR